MKNQEHLLISLEERHADNILAGTKNVELRRRTMHVNEGDFVWLYVKKPIGAVVGYAVVGECTTGAPASVWRRFGSVSGLMKSEFMSYFNGAAAAFALGVDAPKALMRPVALADLRGASPGFHPPQFYCRLDSGSVLRDLLTRSSKPRS